MQVSGGAQTTEFDIYADQYDANKHFFLAHYFKEEYNSFLANLPFVNSQINITKVEVWVTNKTGVTENSRNIVAFLDLGETGPSQDNDFADNFESDNFTNPLPGIYPDNDQGK